MSFTTVSLRIVAIVSFFWYLYIWVQYADYQYENFFWDLNIYDRAINDLGAGINPYRLDVGGLFIYHPLVLNTMNWVNHFIKLKYFLVSIYCLATGFFLFQVQMLFKEAYIKSKDGNLANNLIEILICAIAFGGVGVISVLTGNITIYLHMLLFGLMLGYVRTNQNSYLYSYSFLLPLIALIKPYFLSYLLLFYLFKRKKIIYLCILWACLVFVMTWFYSVIFDPIRYGDFLNALKQQIQNGGDVGYSFYGVLRVFNVSDPVLLAIHGLVSLFLIWLGLFSIPKNLEIENNLVAKFLLATFVIVIINPRMKEYDLCIGVVSFFLLLRGTCPEYKKIMLIGLLCSISIWGNAFSKIIFPQFFLNGNVWQIIAIFMMMFFYLGLPNRKPRIR